MFTAFQMHARQIAGNAARQVTATVQILKS